MTMTLTHSAAISLAKGTPFTVQTRPTPKPGPDELLIAVKSVALNPADGIMREQGLFIPSYPTVIGFDIAGLVLDVGENVPTGIQATTALDLLPIFQPGTPVAAYAASVWKSCDANYGAFQERCLVPWQHAVPLPTEGITWNQAATLPVAVEVPLSAWDMMGIPRAGETTRSRPSGTHPTTTTTTHQKKNVLLIWGASSSVGTMGVQTARLLRDDPTSSFAAVYATARPEDHTYVASLGADRVFDYRDPGVIDAIVSAARADGLVIRQCFLATGQLGLCQAVLRAFVVDDLHHGSTGKKVPAKIASAPVVPPDAEVVDGVETIFVMPSMDEGERLAQFRYWMGTWLLRMLRKGSIRPSPEVRVVGRGLEAINDGLDVLQKGVCCTKLVVEVTE